MKKFILTIFLTFTTVLVFSQISPYQLSTEFAFGVGGRMTFTGEFPSSTNGTTSTMGTNTSQSPENSTAIVYTDKTRALYTNTMQMYNNNPLTGGLWTNNIYSQLTNAICAGSCTGGGVLFPDPTTPNAFYYISGNDLTGGSCQNKGNNRIRFTGYPLSTYDAGHGIVNVDIDANVGENITVGADRSGGYWLATHDKGNGNIFKIWHYSTSGITGPITYDMVQNFTASAVGQSAIRFSPCMDKIAFTGANWVVVYEFDNVSGVVDAPIWESGVGVGSGTGLEFSPDGDRIYWSGNNTGIKWHDITDNTDGGAGAGSDKSWSMQLGNDGSIYTSPGGSTSLGRIDDANSAPLLSSVFINGGGNVYRGITNLAWLSPSIPVLSYTSPSCTDFNFNFQFRNYYGTSISVKPTEATIDFGDGIIVANPSFPISHTYISNGTYIVTYTYKDLFCDQIWTSTQTVVVSCAPLKFMDNKNISYNKSISCPDFNIYPNPSNNTFNIQSCESYTYEIFDIPGKVLEKGKDEKSIGSNLKNGVYIVRFILDNEIIIYKLNKQ